MKEGIFTKKFLSIILAVVMVIGIIPFADLGLKTEASSSFFQWPMSGYTTSQVWGKYSSKRASEGKKPYHSGIDMVSSNKNIYAAADGTVIYRGFTNGNGNHVIIEHTVNNVSIKSLYSHLDSFANCPNVNQRVTKGTVIGIMGNTGNSSGAHLHFGMFSGSSTDPLGYTSSYGENVVTEGCTYYNPKYVIENNIIPGIGSITNNGIQFHGISNVDNTSCGIDGSTTFTASGTYKYWFKDEIADSNHYINIYLDGVLITDRISHDSNGYSSVIIDSNTIASGYHELKAEIVHTNGSASVIKGFYSQNNDVEKPVIAKAEVAQMYENGYTAIAKVSDNVGVTKVVFPTWIPGQTESDIQWLEGTYDPTYDHWACWIPVSSWNGHYGTYYTDVYAYDAAGNTSLKYEIRDIHVPSVNSDCNALASSGTYDLSAKPSIYVSGWAYNRNGDTVKLHYRFDGEGNPWYQFDLVDRTDVTGIYSDCKQVKCGYDKNISIADMSAGKHIIDIIVETDNWSKVIASSTFTVVRPESYVYFDMNDGSDNRINLFAPQKATSTVNGVTYSYDGATGIMTMNGSSSTDVSFFSKPFTAANGDIYKISADYISGTVSNGLMVLEVRDNDGNRINADIANSDKSATWSISSTQASKINRLELWAWKDSSGNKLTFSNYKVKIKIEKVSSNSDSATAFTPNAKYLAYGQTYATMPVPVREGYTFNGWYTAKTGGTKIEASTVFKNGSSQTLYAQWDSKTYTVTYDANGGTGAPSNATVNTSYTISSTVPKKFGYTFLGWSKTNNATAAAYIPGDTITVASNTTLYAVWKTATAISAYKPYTATIEFRGQEVYYYFTPTETTRYKFGSVCNIDSRIYIYDASGNEIGYDDDDGEDYNFLLDVDLKSGTKYYVKISTYGSDIGDIAFVADTVSYSVSYNANGGVGAPSSHAKRHDINLLLSATKPTRTGYTFTGWNAKADGSGTSYAAGATYTSNAAVTLYAQWKINTFAVSYNANGGSGAPSAQTKTYGTNLTLSTTKPTRTGYTFTGWNTKADGSGTSYSSGATYTTNAALTLYAQWKIDTYTISYALNGGSVTTANPTSYNVTTASFTLNNPTRTGYTFAGWTGTGLSAATKTVTVAKSSTGNRSYTATWTANTGIKYVVNHYQMNVNGSGYTLKETENKTGTTASSVTVANLKKTYAGFTYEGGKGATTATSTKPSTLDTTTTVLADGTRVINLYYSRNKYALTLSKGTGISAVTGAGTYYYGQSVTIDATVASGYTWSKWSDNNTTKKATITMPANEVTITANATLNSYTISYTLNGGSVTTANPTSYNVTTASFTLNNPTRAGYTFAGWTGTGLSAATKTVTVAKGSIGNRSYTATWTANTYTVTFNANGGSCDTASKNVTYAATYGTLPTPTKTGYVFNGWYTSSSGGTKITSSTNVSITANQTLYAQWTEIVLTSISVKTNPSVVSYYVGDTLSTSGLTLTAKYSDGSTKTITSGFTCAPTTLDTAGTQKITITYGGKTTSFNVTVEEVTLASIAVKSNPTKTSYYVGDTLNTNGLTLTAIYNNGTTKTITSGFTCAPTTLDTAGTQKITVTYGGKTTSFNVTVEEVVLASIAVKSNPTKTNYYVGDTLNTSGLTLTATYNNGTTKTISSGFTCTPTTLNTVGAQRITVTYGGKTTSFDVTVDNVTLTSIAVNTNPDKTNYYLGDTLDTSGLTLTATYNNGKTETISSGFTCTPTKLETAGTQKITVTYGGKTASFNVTVEDVVVSSIAVKNEPNNTSYYVGDSLDTTGFTLTASYNNGTSKTISSGFTCTPTTFSSAGTQKITVTYGGKTTSFNVTVENVVLTSITVKTVPAKTSYFVGETLDTSGMTLTATYNNGATKTVNGGFTCTPEKLETAGTQKITVTYGDKSTSFNVEVKAVEVSGISIASVPETLSYYVGDTLSTEGLSILVTYNNGTVETITSGFTCSPSTLNTEGTQKITVTYGGKTATFNVSVATVKVTELEIVTAPQKTSYKVGDKFDPTGLTMNAVNSKGEEIVVTEGFVCTPEILEKAGTQVVTVSYGGKSIMITVVVEEEKAETYVVKFISNGVVISEEEYEAGEAIVKPADPTLAGYKFMGWTPDVPTVMPEEALTFTAKFEKSYICPDCGDEILGEAEINAHIAAEARMKATVKIKNNPGSRTIKYGEILRLTAITNNMPADAKIYWYVDGVKRGEGTTFEVSPTSGSVQVTVKLVDSRGNVLENTNGDEISDSQKVAVNAGFFQKLISFFKNLFGMNRTLVQVVKTTF